MLYSVDSPKNSTASGFSRTAHAKKAFSAPPWTRAEGEKVSSLYPDYDALQEALPRRSRVAIMTRVQVLNLKVINNRWTAPAAKMLEDLARSGATRKEIAEALGCTVSRITYRMKYQHVRLVRRTSQKSDYPIFDQIRKRAVEFGSIAALDRELKTGEYFKHAGQYRPDWNRVARALEILGGELIIKWCEDE